MVFQNALPLFLSRGTILNYKQGDFVFEKEVLATLVNYTQQTEDIVQGLPKIEELIEARIPKIKATLALTTWNSFKFGYWKRIN
jgi:DNA-directed RNA polymerase subunit beta'